MAKKQKDKKINNGRYNNTQTNREKMAQKHNDKKINNGRHNNTQTNRQYNGRYKRDKSTENTTAKIKDTKVQTSQWPT